MPRAITKAPTRRAASSRTKVRKASEFDLRRLTASLTAPARINAAYTWLLEDIRGARDNQLTGSFALPARLAESMRTDDALFVAYKNRLAPQQAISVELRAGTGASGAHTAESVAAEAEPLYGASGAGIEPGALADINGCLANHGVAIGYVTHTPRADGSRIDLTLSAWPIEYVYWDGYQLITRVDSVPEAEQEYSMRVSGSRCYSEVPIVHGDGRWVVFQKHSIDPWKQDAALLPAALVWARHAFAARDWAKGSLAHGSAKAIGELPEGYPLTDAAGALTADAAAFLALLQALISADSPAGIRPAGSKTEFLANTSTAWQVWAELMTNAEKAAARIYLGTDGVLGAQGGAPGVDITALFGVATTIVQGDLRCIERGIKTGLLDVWAAINFGDSSLAPWREYQIPDADEDAVRESFGKRNSALFSDLKAAKESGCVVDQKYVDNLAQQHGVPAPTLAVGEPIGAGFFAYELDGGIPTIDEVRATKGMGPHPNGLGYLTVPQMKALPPGAAPPPPPPAANPTAPTTPAPGDPDAAIGAQPGLDPDGDGEPGEPSSIEDRKRLADKMTAEGVEKCQHGASNRCRLCGIERKRDFEKDPDTGEIVWLVIWKPIED